jgi:hypothetical protein
VPSPSRLAEILASAARRLRADFDDSATITHRGSKGTVREHDVLEFLQKYLPDNVRAAGSAEIVSADGQTSGQMDIVIYDPTAPPLFDRGGYRILPAECVYGVIEVKSRLDAAALRTSVETIAQVKRLPKIAYFPQLFERQPEMYGKTYPGYCPTVGYIFAYDSSDLLGMSDEFIQTLKTQPYEKRIDAVWVLGRGAYNWIDPVSQAPSPRAGPGLWLSVGTASPEQGVLLNMVATIGTHMAQAFMPPFNMLPYIKDATFVESATARGPVDYLPDAPTRD